MQDFSSSPRALLSSLLTNRGLVAALVKREVFGRYQGSLLGIFWSFVHPLLMLVVYTFVFSVIFRSRWESGSETQAEFALVLYSGLIVFQLFSDCLTRAPTLILSHVNFVKKVVFPLEILPMAVLGSALFHAAASFIIWLGFHMAILGFPNGTIFLVPFVLIPLCALALGASWCVASVGVYLRDLSQVVGVAITALLFLSAIFYPLSALPEGYQTVFQLNPLAFAVEEARKVMIWGELPEFTALAELTGFSFLIAWLGFACFQKLRKGFPDVV